VYPIRVPVVFDRRAAADRVKEEKVSELAREILGSKPNAIVIADAVAEDVKSERVFTFQGAKGVNGLEDRDVYVIVRNLHPEKYAELNVLGQWLERTDVIDTFYADQLNQAVGRNRGFRDNGKGTKTVVITSLRLWAKVLERMVGGASRTLLYPTNDKFW
jgi:hypothetical protein